MTTHRCLAIRLWSHGLTGAVDHLFAVAARGDAGHGFFCNAHMIAESRQNPRLLAAMRRATWVFPDGKPVAMLLKLRGARTATQVPGPETMELLLAKAAATALPIYLFGGAEAVLTNLQRDLPIRYPGLIIAGAHSPPFHAWTPEEEAADAERIRASGARICFVALGCPKQELWLQRNARHLPLVSLAVGAAFPMLAGLTPRAPGWARTVGLEWAYRWAQEPRRLAHRYTVSNIRFLAAARREIGTRRIGKVKP